MIMWFLWGTLGVLAYLIIAFGLFMQAFHHTRHVWEEMDRNSMAKYSMQLRSRCLFWPWYVSKSLYRDLTTNRRAKSAVK